jgi:hypothetical protein
MLKEKYEVTKFNYDPYIDTMDKFKELNNQKFDVVVLFQIMPPMALIKNNVKFENIIFFPMYDGVPSLTNIIWYGYKDCNIINFSKTLHEKCKKVGLSSYYIQYFPEPKEISNLGDEKSVFLWQRITTINPKIVDAVIGFDNIEKFYHHQAPDPKHKIIEVPECYKHKTEVSTWFKTKEEMEQHLQKSAIYFAPRCLEGIGMSFLGAMAMGRCIIAPNNPTMNEYIEDGINGYLYDLKNPERISIRNIKQIQENTIQYVKNGYSNWEKNKYNILDWIESDVKQNRNDKLLMENLLSYTLQKKKFIGITYLKKKITDTHKMYYLFGFLPIYKKKRKLR